MPTRPNISLIFTLLALLCSSGRALAQEPSAPPPLSAEDYARRASQALQQGNALLAGQILMLSYQDHAELGALYVAGIAFEQAGRTDLAIKAWSIFICTSPDTARVASLRERLRSKKASQPCRTTEEDTPDEDRDPTDLRLDFEIETGFRFGDEFALTWAPGVWFGFNSKFRFGIFLPLVVGELSSVGVEARTRMRLQPGISGELSLGLHRVERYTDTSTSYGAGINFGDVLTVGIKRQSFGSAGTYDGVYSADFLDATFTGKTGTTIVAIEAGLALLVFGLAVGSAN